MKDKFSTKERFDIIRMMFGGHTDQYDYHHVGLFDEGMNVLLGEAGFTNAKRIEDFGIFADTSTGRMREVLISLNLIVTK